MATLSDRLQPCRPALARAGLVLMCAGGALIAAGVISFISCYSRSLVSRWFILAFFGMPLAALGMAASLTASWLASRLPSPTGSSPASPSAPPPPAGRG